MTPRDELRAALMADHTPDVALARLALELGLPEEARAEVGPED